MEPGKDKVGSAKAKVSKIIESPDTDPTKGAKTNKPANPWDWNTDSGLKPNATGKDSRIDDGLVGVHCQSHCGFRSLYSARALSGDAAGAKSPRIYYGPDRAARCRT